MAARETGKPLDGYVDEYVTAEVLIVRIEPTAEASLAAIRDRSKFGIAMAAMIKMIATTISNSISQKPFCFSFIVAPFESNLECFPRGTHRYSAPDVPNRSKGRYLLHT